MGLSGAPTVADPSAGAEPYSERNLLDRISRPATLELHYEHLRRRERELAGRHLGISRGEVLSVGCGWHPGRHLFPAPAFRLVGVDTDPARVAAVLEAGRADEAFVGQAGRLDYPEQSFDIVLYRLVMHHIAFKSPLWPVFAEAAALLRPGGALVVVEPGLWHPVGLALAAANRVGAATAIHGTPDDVPLSPRRLAGLARAAGLEPQLHAVTYAWRRLPTRLQRALWRLDALGSRPRTARFGHTLMLIAHKPRPGGPSR
jgi:SAM-dependent methyltransferase